MMAKLEDLNSLKFFFKVRWELNITCDAKHNNHSAHSKHILTLATTLYFVTQQIIETHLTLQCRRRTLAFINSCLHSKHVHKV